VLSVDANELASTPSELPSTTFQSPFSASVLQQQESVKRVGSVTHRMLSNPEPCAVPPQPSDTSSVSSQGIYSLPVVFPLAQFLSRVSTLAAILI